MPPKTLYDFLDTFREQSVPGGAHSVIDSLLELEEAAPDVTSVFQDLDISHPEELTDQLLMPTKETLESLEDFIWRVPYGATTARSLDQEYTEPFRKLWEEEGSPFIKQYTPEEIKKRSKNAKAFFSRQVIPGATYNDYITSSEGKKSKKIGANPGFEDFYGPYTDTLHIPYGDMNSAVAELAHGRQWKDKTPTLRDSLMIAAGRQEQDFGKLAYGKEKDGKLQYPVMELETKDGGSIKSPHGLPFWKDYEEGEPVPVEFEAHQLIEPILKQILQDAWEEDFLIKHPRFRGAYD